MGVVPYEFEVTSVVSPARYFKALVLESQKLFPLAAPQVIKSVEVQGDGGPGSIIKINFAEGLPFKYAKDEIEEVDKDNLSYRYSLIEGGPVGDEIEKIGFENKFVAAAGGETVCKSLTKYYTIGDNVDTEYEHKVLTAATEVVYKAVETYILANPVVCN